MSNVPPPCEVDPPEERSVVAVAGEPTRRVPVATVAGARVRQMRWKRVEVALFMGLFLSCDWLVVDLHRPAAGWAVDTTGRKWTPFRAMDRTRGPGRCWTGDRLQASGGRMGALPRPDVGAGPHRDLVVALHRLHHEAGWPSLRSLAREVGCSPTTV